MPTTETYTAAQIVAEVRERFAKIRTINRNNRLRRYDGRNSRSTLTHLAALNAEAQANLRELPPRLQGFLTAEHKLAERISENRDLGNDRPELRNRIRVLRNAIRTEIGAASNRSQVIR